MKPDGRHPRSPVSEPSDHSSPGGGAASTTPAEPWGSAVCQSAGSGAFAYIVVHQAFDDRAEPRRVDRHGGSLADVLTAGGAHALAEGRVVEEGAKRTH